MSAAIIAYQDDEPVTEFQLVRDQAIVLGRSSTAAVHVRDPKLSRKHCEIRPTADGYVIRDLESRNGTFVNGARVSEALLRDGDRIQIGLTRLVFRSEQFPGDEATDVAPTHQCAACGAIIPLDAVGAARQSESRIYCAACIGASDLLGRTIGAIVIMETV